MPIFTWKEWKSLSLARLNDEINSGTNFNVRNANGITPLMAAAMFNSEPEIITKIMRSKSAQIECWDEFGRNALSLAVIYNTNPEIVKALSGGRVSANVKDEWGNTALTYSLRNHTDPAFARVLVAEGADVNVQDNNGKSLLMLAAIEKKPPEFVEILLDAGIDLDIQDNRGCKALYYAVLQPETSDIALLLLQAGADITSTYSLAGEKDLGLLHITAKSGSPKVAEALIRVGAPVNRAASSKFSYSAKYGALSADVASNSIENTGMTPLMQAAAYNPDPTMIKKLLDNGADIQAETKAGWNALHVASVLTTNPKIIQILVDAGTNIEGRTKIGQTPLMLAAGYNSNEEVTQTIISAGANINSLDDGGQSPLMYAVGNQRNLDVVNILVQAAASTRLRDTAGKSVEQHIANNRNLSAGHLRGAISNSSNVIWSQITETKLRSMLNYKFAREYPESLYYAAAGNSSTEVIRLLLNAGLDPAARIKNDETPVTAAAAGNANPAVIEMLLEYISSSSVRKYQAKKAIFAAARSNKNMQVIQSLTTLDNGSWSVRERETLLIRAKSNGNAAVLSFLQQEGYVPLHFAASGSDGSPGYLNGDPGHDGSNGGKVELTIRGDMTKPLPRKLSITGTVVDSRNNSQRVSQTYMLRESSYIKVTATGGDGGGGVPGKNGRTAQPGGNGGDGGNGGSGGRIILHLPEDAPRNPDWLRYDVSGGTGGEEGTGGKGGNADRGYTETRIVEPGYYTQTEFGDVWHEPRTKEVEIRPATPAGKDGYPGMPGKDGVNGSISIYYDIR